MGGSSFMASAVSGSFRPVSPIAYVCPVIPVSSAFGCLILTVRVLVVSGPFALRSSLDSVRVFAIFGRYVFCFRPGSIHSLVIFGHSISSFLLSSIRSLTIPSRLVSGFIPAIFRPPECSGVIHILTVPGRSVFGFPFGSITGRSASGPIPAVLRLPGRSGFIRIPVVFIASSSVRVLTVSGLSTFCLVFSACIFIGYTVRTLLTATLFFAVFGLLCIRILTVSGSVVLACSIPVGFCPIRILVPVFFIPGLFRL